MKKSIKILISLLFAIISGGTVLYSAELTVAWADNPEPDIAGYKIYLGTAPEVYDQVTNVGNTTQYTLENLNDGTIYYMAISAYDFIDNESEKSAEVSFYVAEENPVLKNTDMDYGDAPEPMYSTLLSSNGARHMVIPGFHLGESVDIDPDGQPSEAAMVDDLTGVDDDDGINFPPVPMIQFYEHEITVEASVGGGFLNAWMDFNRDGDWEDPGEQILADVVLLGGQNTLSFQVPLIDITPPDRTIGVISRFRFGTERGMAYEGPAIDGEVEDYMADILTPVELSSMEARSVDANVVLNWRTSTETENLGFNIYRSEIRNGRYERVNPIIIKGAGNSEFARDYRYIDNTVRPDKEYYYKLADINFDGSECKHNPVRVKVTAPVDYDLEQNYPNPFNPETTISFKMKNEGQVSLKIYNVRGQLIRTLVDEYRAAGSHHVIWDGNSDTAEKLPSGTYIYSLSSKEFQAARKMLFIK